MQGLTAAAVHMCFGLRNCDGSRPAPRPRLPSADARNTLQHHPGQNSELLNKNRLTCLKLLGTSCCRHPKRRREGDGRGRTTSRCYRHCRIQIRGSTYKHVDILVCRWTRRRDRRGRGPWLKMGPLSRLGQCSQPCQSLSWKKWTRKQKQWELSFRRIISGK